MGCGASKGKKQNPDTVEGNHVAPGRFEESETTAVPAQPKPQRRAAAAVTTDGGEHAQRGADSQFHSADNNMESTPSGEMAHASVRADVQSEQQPHLESAPAHGAPAAPKVQTVERASEPDHQAPAASTHSDANTTATPSTQSATNSTSTASATSTTIKDTHHQPPDHAIKEDVPSSASSSGSRPPSATPAIASTAEPGQRQQQPDHHSDQENTAAVRSSSSSSFSAGPSVTQSAQNDNDNSNPPAAPPSDKEDTPDSAGQQKDEGAASDGRRSRVAVTKAQDSECAPPSTGDSPPSVPSDASATPNDRTPDNVEAQKPSSEEPPVTQESPSDPASSSSAPRTTGEPTRTVTVKEENLDHDRDHVPEQEQKQEQENAAEKEKEKEKEEEEREAERQQREREQAAEKEREEAERRRLELEAEAERVREAAQRMEAARLRAEMEEQERARQQREAEEKEAERAREAEEQARRIRELEQEERRRQQEEEERQQQEALLREQQEEERLWGNPLLMRASEEHELALMAQEEVRSDQREAQEAERLRLLREAEQRRRQEEEARRLRLLEEEAARQDQRDALDPAFLSLFVVFVADTTSGISSNRVYRFHLRRDASPILADLKSLIHADFGYTPHQQRFCYLGVELRDEQSLLGLPQWRDDQSYLVMFPLGLPAHPPAHVVRPLQVRPSLSELKLSNAAVSESDAQTDTDGMPVYRNWTEEYMMLRARLEEGAQFGSEERLAAELAYTQLLNNFHTAAERAAWLVVQHRVIPTDPVALRELYGVGGEKFIVGGMLLRVASDWIVPGGSFVTTGDGEIALKVAAHEYRMLNLLRGKISGLQVPLTCMVDINGVRFLVQSILPIDHDTLVYGSATDGLVVEHSDGAQDVAARVAALLNLKPHDVRERLTDRVLPGHRLPYTVEIHRPPHADHDDLTPPVHFLLSAGRLMPPDTPHPADPLDAIARLLRPEFVGTYSLANASVAARTVEESPAPTPTPSRTPLPRSASVSSVRSKTEKVPAKPAESDRRPTPSSLVLSVDIPGQLTPLNPDAFMADQPTQDRHEVLVAAQHLARDVVTQFVKELDTLTVEINTGEELVAEMHERGINVRFLGHMISTLKAPHLRELALREVVIRVAKTLIRDGLSFVRPGAEAHADSGPVAVVVHYLNALFGAAVRRDDVADVEGEEGGPEDDATAADARAQVWRYVEELARKKYGLDVVREGGRSMLSRLYLVPLVHSLCERLGVRLVSRPADKHLDFARARPFDAADIVAVDAVVRKAWGLHDGESTVQRLLGEARELDATGKRSKWYLAGGPERERATEIYRRAVAAAERVHGKDSVEAADVYFMFAEHLESRHAERGRPQNSRWNRCAHVPRDHLSDEAEYFYRRTLETRQRAREHTPGWGRLGVGVAECLLGLARVCKDVIPARHRDDLLRHPRGIRDGDDGAPHWLASYVPAQLMEQAVALLQGVVGFNHPLTAEVYAQTALLYHELQDSERASPFVRRAFVATASVFGLEHEQTQDLHKILVSIELQLDDHLDRVPLHDLVDHIERLTFDDTPQVRHVQHSRLLYSGKHSVDQQDDNPRALLEYYARQRDGTSR